MIKKASIKKILSFILCLCLVVSAFSTLTAFAENTDFSADSSKQRTELFKASKKDIAFRKSKLDLRRYFESENVKAEMVGASGSFGENLTWSLSSSGKLTISGNGYMDDYSFITGSYAPWLDYYESITSVVINKGVRNVGNEAFIICGNLKSVSIPSTVEYIGISAFEECYSLTSISIPEGVKYIDSFAFSTSGIASLNIPSSVIYVGECVTAMCSNLKTISVSSGNEYYVVLNNCLVSRESKTLISGCIGSTIPDDPFLVHYIGEYAFSGISSIVDLTIPENIANIASTAFLMCENIVSITALGEDAAYYSTGNALIHKNTKALALGCKNSIIPTDGSVEKIGDYAFCGVALPSSLTIPSSVTHIGTAAFYGCENINQIYLPETLVKIGSYAFDETKYYNTSSITNWENGIMYIRSYAVSIEPNFSKTFCNLRKGTRLMADSLFAGCTSLETVTLPESLINISEYAFSFCEGIKTISIPSSISTIDNSSFAFCSSLSSVSIPETVKTIKDGAFMGCSSLSKIKLPSALCSIGQYAFYSCSDISEIEIPQSVLDIGMCAFANCSNLETVRIMSSNSFIGEFAFGYSLDLENGEILANEALKIHGYKNSTAEDYASQNNMIFIPFQTEETKDEFYINEADKTMPYLREKTTVNELSKAFYEKGLTISVKDKNGKELAGNNNIGTGAVISTSDGKIYTAIVCGDVDGNGTIDSTDYLQIKKVFLKEMSLQGAFLSSADTNNDGTINTTDYMQIKKYFIGGFDLYK